MQILCNGAECRHTSVWSRTEQQWQQTQHQLQSTLRGRLRATVQCIHIVQANHYHSYQS